MLEFDTQSLILRRFTEDDRSGLYELTRQKEITDILPEWEMSDEQLKAFLAFVISSYETYDPQDVRIMLAIVHKSDKKLIGWCGVFPNDKLDPSKREIAYAISRDYRGHGYACEAVLGMTAFIFAQSSLNEIVAIVKPFNTGSRRVLEKSAFMHQRIVRLSDGEDYDYYVCTRPGALVKPVLHQDIEPYLDLLAEVEHTGLNRNHPDHERWLRRRISSFYARGAEFFAYHDPLNSGCYGILSVLHEPAPEGIEALGARAEVLQIGVSRGARRNGAGSLLLAHAESYARKRGAYCLFVMTYAGDYDVIAFYGKNGFVPAAALPDVYGPRLEGNLFLRKILLP